MTATMEERRPRRLWLKRGDVLRWTRWKPYWLKTLVETGQLKRFRLKDNGCWYYKRYDVERLIEE